MLLKKKYFNATVLFAEKKTKIILFLIFVFFSTTKFSFAQFYNGSQTNFGKSRVQYNEFIWMNLRFEKFDTYFYLGGKPLAVFTAQCASKHIKEIESKLDYVLEDKIQFVIFTKYSDFKESNLGISSDEQINVGGTTTILGTKVVLYFNGNHKDLEDQIRFGISKIIINQILYGESITSKIKNTTLLSLPDWYTEGLASYIAFGWNTDMDNLVKDGIVNKGFKKFNHLTGQNAINAGHSLWNFIAEKYGEAVIPNILYMARISRNLESGFLYVVGVSYKNIINDWFKFYERRFAKFDETTAFENEKLKIKNKNFERKFDKIRISPDGKTVAYVSDELGQKKVWLYNLETKKTKRILKYDYKLVENSDKIYPLIEWHPSGKILTIIKQKRGKTQILLYSLETKKTDVRALAIVDKVNSFSYSSDGKQIVMSAVQQSETDIFVYYMASRSLEQITKDSYDDLEPCFMNNNTIIAFSSNRTDDTLVFGKYVTPEKLQQNRDLFLYNFKNKNYILMRITKTPHANEIKPIEYANQNLMFISNQNGINNRYIAKIDSIISFIDTTTHYKFVSTYFPITDYPLGIIDHSISQQSNTISEIIYSKGKTNLYTKSYEPVTSLKPLKLNNTAYITKLLRKKTESKIDSTLKQKQTGTKTKKITNVTFDTTTNINNRKVDINNYSFENNKLNNIKNPNVDSLALLLMQKKIKEDSIRKNTLYFHDVRNTYVEYSISQLVTQFDYSFLNASYQIFSGGKEPIYTNPSFSGLFKVGLTDLFEDRKIIGGFRLSGSLDNNEYLLTYENLKHRIDKSITFHRMSYNNYINYSTIKHRTHEFYYRLSYPFDEVISIRGTLIYRNDRAVFLSTDMQNLKKENDYKNWGGLKGEFVFDNTRNKALNIYYGTRFKAFGEYYKQLDQQEKNFTVVGFDLRHYHKINKTFIWANRLAASTSFGKQKLIYYLGGVDNWMFPKFDSITNVAADQNYAYQTVATNMRGFAQNIRNGNSFAVFNSELRLPVFNYFFNRPVKSDFFNNFQIVAFTDVGTAWTGPNPYSDENSLYKEVIIQKPIKVTIITQKEPIVGSFGCGLRSRLLGYFIRGDLAWGIEDGVIYKPMFHFSLSLDF